MGPEQYGRDRAPPGPTLSTYTLYTFTTIHRPPLFALLLIWARGAQCVCSRIARSPDTGSSRALRRLALFEIIRPLLMLLMHHPTAPAQRRRATHDAGHREPRPRTGQGLIGGARNTEPTGDRRSALTGSTSEPYTLIMTVANARALQAQYASSARSPRQCAPRVREFV
jgi:hypothetical protein